MQALFNRQRFIIRNRLIKKTTSTSVSESKAPPFHKKFRKVPAQIHASLRSKEATMVSIFLKSAFANKAFSTATLCFISSL